MAAANKYGTYKVKGIPIGSNHVTRGNRWFVHSGTGNDAGNAGTTIGEPFATLDYANGKCVDDAGDIIEVLAGHSETTGKSTLDVDGVHVRGHGGGLSRPAFGTATADDIITITGDNVTVENIQIGTLGIDAITAFININGPGATIRNIYASN